MFVGWTTWLCFEVWTVHFDSRKSKPGNLGPNSVPIWKCDPIIILWSLIFLYVSNFLLDWQVHSSSPVEHLVPCFPMSSSLLRNTQTSLNLSCRQWLLHRCIHLSTQPSITLEPATLPDSENESVNRRSSKRRQSTKKISHNDEGLPQNRVSLHLEKIRENPLKLEDIETQRPSQIPNSLSADYEEKYRSVIESLDKAFTVKQMHDFLETNKIPLPRRKTKLGLAAQILEQKWGWETLDTVLQRKVDWSQVVEEGMSLFLFFPDPLSHKSVEFPLDKVEAFLLMGKGQYSRY